MEPQLSPRRLEHMIDGTGTTQPDYKEKTDELFVKQEDSHVTLALREPEAQQSCIASIEEQNPIAIKKESLLLCEQNKCMEPGNSLIPVLSLEPGATESHQGRETTVPYKGEPSTETRNEGGEPEAGLITSSIRKLPKSRKRKHGEHDATPNVLVSLTGNIFEAAVANESRLAPASFQDTRKGKALASLQRDAPKERMEDARADRIELEKATRILGSKTRQIRPDGKGRWLVKGMSEGSALYNYQLLAAAFMLKRETGRDKPRGGILANEMGLGKTVITIAVMLQNPPNPKKHKPTLIVTTVGLIDQWEEELRKHLVSTSKTPVYKYRKGHGVSADVLSIMHYIITTYQDIANSYPKYDPPRDFKDDGVQLKKWWDDQLLDVGVLHTLEYHRVVIDEAQFIKNHKSHTSLACRGLEAAHHWALSGTLIQNRVDELFAFFRFIKHPQVGEFKEFKMKYCANSESADKELQGLLSKVMHRDTHNDELFGKKILELPPTHQQIEWLKFDEIERKLYDIFNNECIKRINKDAKSSKLDEARKKKHILKMLTVLRRLTAHILLVEKDFHDILGPIEISQLREIIEDESQANNQYRSILQQLRSHSAPPTSPADGSGMQDEVAPAPAMSLTSNTEHGTKFLFRKYLPDPYSARDKEFDDGYCGKCKDLVEEPQITSCGHTFCQECLLFMTGGVEKDVKNVHCPLCNEHITSFQSRYILNRSGTPGSYIRQENSSNKPQAWENVPGKQLPSSKLMALKVQIIEWKRVAPKEKIIVFTQWTGMVKIIYNMCLQEGWGAKKFDGWLTPDARRKAINAFKAKDDITILIASLKCGGVGLNLTVASRIISIDPWWNECAEAQAFARVYRIGQEKVTHITRFLIKDTVDEKIIGMQERKKSAISRAMGDDNKSPIKFDQEELLSLFGTVKRDVEGRAYIATDEDDDSSSENTDDESSISAYDDGDDDDSVFGGGDLTDYEDSGEEDYVD